jgi:hypothetical protein
VTARQAVDVENPADGDALSAASNNAATQELADILKWLMNQAALIGGSTNADVLRLEGLAGDTNPAAQMQTVPTARKLVLELASHATVKTRIYSELLTATPDDDFQFGGVTITTNARWTGTGWAADDLTFGMGHFHIGVNGVKVNRRKTGTNPASHLDFTQYGYDLRAYGADSGTMPAGTLLGALNGTIQPIGLTAHVHPGVRLIGDPGEPVFENAFSYDPGQRRPGYWKDAFGVVHLQGKIYLGASSAVAFTLPVGYRPSGQLKVRVASDVAVATAVEVWILTSGQVVITTSSGATDCWLDGITFLP